jgi:regulator of sigma E protease
MPTPPARPTHAEVARMSPRGAGALVPGPIRSAERAAIVAAGPIANFLLAIFIFAATVFVFGKQVLIPASIRSSPAVPPSAPACGRRSRRGNRRPADRSFNDMQRAISARPDETFSVTIERAGRCVTVPVTPALVETESPVGKQKIGVIGVQASRKAEDWTVSDSGPSSFRQGGRLRDLVRRRAHL